MVPHAPCKFTELPEDILLEICYFLDMEDVFSLRQVNRRVYNFSSTRHLWYKFTFHLYDRVPLALPPFRPRISFSAEELHSICRHGLRLENNWRSDYPTPYKKPRYLELSKKEDGVMMLRLLPGGRFFLVVTAKGELTCRDSRDGRIVGECIHGGNKVHSIDVDVVEDGRCIILAVSVDQPRSKGSSNTSDVHMVHVLRIDIIENPKTGPRVEFIHIMASPWDYPWWIVSLEGDIVAAYSCILEDKPLRHFVVWIANWKTATAAVIHLPQGVIPLETWPTLQVVGGQVIIHEERGGSPASIVFPVPDTLFSTNTVDHLPQVKITPTLILKGDRLDNAYQTRFSKIWRNACPQSAAKRPISLFSISAMPDSHSRRTIKVQTFDPFPTPDTTKSSVGTSRTPIPRSKNWSRSAIVPFGDDGLRFTFCLGRYGSFPIWIEEDGQAQLHLMGLFTDQKNGGTCHVKELVPPEGVDLDRLHCLDFDDAEGILCAVTERGVWIVEY
ncbi:hypothetical protein Clacol_003933 [Clathrus columnatus]|uniref:F-box domain-containing protein n=1 Tax=Clathrus columnatus TaxID=1419009 RepID=A0AAV5A918_9AGAM|nr:hypothetical protein Clacol_003933 [Clathrus columnatus]